MTTAHMKLLFEKLGLSDKEAKAWLKMLQLGAQPISVIAKHVGIPRSSMYVMIENLKALQLVEEFERGGMRYAKTIQVGDLENILKAREREVQESLEILKDRMSDLQKMENSLGILPTVRFFEGHNEIIRMYEEVLREEEFRAFFDPKIVSEIMPIYYKNVAKKIKEQRRKAKEILVDCKEAREYQKNFCTKLYQIKILPREMMVSADLMIGKDKIYMVAYDQKLMCGTEICNATLAQSHKVLFDQLWKRI